MRFITPVLVFASCLTSSVGTAQEYKLVWSDEFDQDGPPSADRWRFERGFVRNGEQQWYQPDNAICKAGCLCIEARRESKPNPDTNPRRRQPESIKYTSSSLTTRGKQSWQFGRFEIKARIDACPGLWPAIWTIGDRGEWPSCGEIDIMEYYDDSLLANACWGTKNRFTPKWDSSKTALTQFGDNDWDQQFHVWRMDWNEQSIKLFVDDRMLNEIDLSKTVNANELGPTNPFHQPHHLLLNLAVGGRHGGDPSDTEFPATFAVDYVRVYQLSE